MSPYPWIAPPNPPLPTARNLPFQSVAGSHSSALICESLDGFRTSFTRQCAGIGCAAGAGAPPPAAGGVNGPAATVSALVTVTFAIETDLSDSHVAAAAYVESENMLTVVMMTDSFVFISDSQPTLQKA